MRKPPETIVITGPWTKGNPEQVAGRIDRSNTKVHGLCRQCGLHLRTPGMDTCTCCREETEKPVARVMTPNTKRFKFLTGLSSDEIDAVLEIVLATLSGWEYRQEHDHRLSPNQQEELSLFADKLSRIRDGLVDMSQHPYHQIALAEDDTDDLLFHVLMDYVNDYNSIAHGLPHSMQTTMFVRHDLASDVARKMLSLPWQTGPSAEKVDD